MELRYFGFAEIYDGSRKTILKKSNDLISETHYPIHFMYAHIPYTLHSGSITTVERI